MNEKVKVSSELGKVLKTILPNGNISGIIRAHVNNTFSEDRNLVYELSTEDFAKCCINGYVVLQTPEEKILEIFNNHAEKPSIQPVWNEGVMDGIKMTLRTFNIKVDGIDS